MSPVSSSGSSDAVLASGPDDEGVRRLTINRPRRKNAIAVDGWAELAGHLTTTAGDGSRAHGIRGAGGDLCAGDDAAAAFAAFREKREPDFTGGWAPNHTTRDDGQDPTT